MRKEYDFYGGERGKHFENREEHILELKTDHKPEDRALAGGCVINMDVRDNREQFRKNREEKQANAQTCRVCGSKDVHSVMYNSPTMGCIEHLRECMAKMKTQLEDFHSLIEEIVGENAWREQDE
jgi:hypothetical protein